MRLRARCNKPSLCRARDTFPNTPRNAHRLEHRDIVCASCGVGKMRPENRNKELAKRERCQCDGVHWSFNNSPHDTNTPGCRHYESRKLDGILAGHVQGDDKCDW